MQEQKNAAARAFDAAIKQNKLKNDAALAVFLGCSPAPISSMRKGRIAFGQAMQDRIVSKGALTARRLKSIIENEEQA